MEDIIIVSNEEHDGKTHLQKTTPKKKSFFSFSSTLTGSGKMKIKDKVIFYRLLATMLNAGMSIVKGMSVLEKQEKDLLIKKMFGEIVISLKEGQTLSDCMDKYGSSFDDSEIGVIRAGEKTGKLNEVMLSLANQVEKVASISGKMKSALMYPAMIMIVVIGVIAVMMVMVVPKLLEIFDDPSQLPATTQALMLISDIFRNYWYVLIALGVAGFIFVTTWKKTPTGKYVYDQLLLNTPVFGTIVKKVVLSKFSRVFAGLMGSGVSVVEGLKIVSEAVGNEVYRQRILLLLEDVRSGMKIWESLDGDPLFPDIMVQMIQVGEQSAKLDATIIKVADFYDEEVNNLASTINKLLEPFIIVFLAVVVGFIALAIMQPIMNLSDTISNA